MQSGSLFVYESGGTIEANVSQQRILRMRGTAGVEDRQTFWHVPSSDQQGIFLAGVEFKLWLLESGSRKTTARAARDGLGYRAIR
jgi:hypothetical protein